MQEHFPQYIIRVYIVNGALFLSWRRRRLYIVLTHQESGGVESAQRQTAMIKAVVAKRAQQPAKNALEFFLPDDDARVQAMIEEGNRRHHTV